MPQTIIEQFSEFLTEKSIRHSLFLDPIARLTRREPILLRNRIIKDPWSEGDYGYDDGYGEYDEEEGEGEEEEGEYDEGTSLVKKIIPIDKRDIASLGEPNDLVISYTEKGDLPGLLYAIRRGACLTTTGERALTNCIEKGHLELVKALLDNGVKQGSAIIQVRFKRLPGFEYKLQHFAYACYCKQFEIAEYLLRITDVSPLALNRAIYETVLENNYFFARKLASLGARPNCIPSFCTMLRHVLWRYHRSEDTRTFDEVKFILSLKPPELTVSEEVKFFEIAVRRDDSSFYDALLEAGLTPSPNEYPFSHAIETDSFKMIEWLLTTGRITAEDLQRSLNKAIEKKNLDLVKLLVERGADVNFISRDPDLGRDAFCLAIEHNNLDIARYLLSKGSNPRRFNDRALKIAIYGVIIRYTYSSKKSRKRINIDSIKMLLDLGLDINGNGGAIEYTMMNISRYCSIHVKDSECIHLIKYLASRGAKVKVTTKFMFSVVNTISIKILSQLIRAGANICTNGFLKYIEDYDLQYSGSPSRREWHERLVRYCVSRGANPRVLSRDFRFRCRV